jgi:hypothetical protein
MKKVWSELYRKRRTDRDQFYNPAKPIKPFSGFHHEMRRHIALLRKQGDSRKSRDADFVEQLRNRAMRCPPLSFKSAQCQQDAASRTLLRAAMQFARSNAEVFTVSDTKSMHKYCEEKASELQHEAFMALVLGLGEEDARKLESVAQTYSKKANMHVPDPHELLEVRRRHGDGEVRAYVLRMAQTSGELFGKHLSGCIANVTNVAFRTNFRGIHIREMTRRDLRSGI